MDGPVTILAGDLATTTGWAVDGSTGPRAGTFVLPSGSRGRRLLAFQEWFYDFGKLNRVRLIAIEAPLLDRHRKETNIEAMRMAFWLNGAAHTMASALKVPIVEITVQEARKSLLGTAYPAEPKRAVARMCGMLGWPTPNFDATDALAIWALAKARHDKTFRLETATPLFGRPAVGAST